MGRLTLLTLGTPEAMHAGKTLRFRTRKALALLIYLSVEGGLHSREKLAALFWPESDVEHARTMLRRTLAILRQTLSDASETAGSEHILVERDALGFNSSSDLDLDVFALDEALRMSHKTFMSTPAASPVSSAPTTVAAPLASQYAPLEALRRAAGSYKGDFLEGFILDDAPAFDEWSGQQREYWHERAGEVMDRLSQLQIATGEVSEARSTLNRWLGLSPLNEAAYARLIRLHLAEGDRDAALRVYEACRSRFADELGMMPSPELQSLAERIRLNAPRVSAQPRPHVSASGSPSALLESSFVGRGKEFARLVELFHRAFRGEMQVCIIQGEAGIGKTRLATEFLGWAASHEADVLQGRAFETGGRVPYQPIVEALRRRLELENAPDDLLPDVWLAELSRLLPELRERYPDLPEPTGDEMIARTRLFEAVARLGQALAARTPLVLLVDDLQWADLASLDLLHYCIQRWAESSSRVLLLCTLREEAITESQSISEWLSSVGRVLPLGILALNLLTPEDILRWVRSLASEDEQGEGPYRGSPPADRDSVVREMGDWLFRRTSGQPFFITETLKSLLERGLLSARQVDGGVWALSLVRGVENEADLSGLVPAGVREMIRSQLIHLTPAALSVVCAGAVLGHDFSFEQLWRVAGVEENDALAAVDLLLRRRFWRESASKGGPVMEYRFLFAHDQIREVVYSEAGEPRRRAFHRRAFVALQSAGAASAELARHALAGGLETHAFRFSLAAGDDAMRLFAVRDALAHYRTAHEIVSVGPELLSHQLGLAHDEVRSLYMALGRAYELLNDWTSADSVYRELLSFARQVHTPGMESLALNRLSTVAAQGTFDLAEAGSLLHEARRAAEESGDRAMIVETEWNMAQLTFYMWDLKGSVAHAEKAMSLIDEQEQRELYARCLNTIAYSRMMMGQDWPEVLKIVAQARARFAELGNKAMEADCLTMTTIIQVNGGFYEAGIAAGREGMGMAREVDNPWGQANSAWSVARGLLESGQLEEALLAAKGGLEAARSAGHPPSLVFNLAMLGRTNCTLFGPEQAFGPHMEALAVSDALQHPLLNDWISSELCLDHVLAGNWDEALKYAQRARQFRDYNTVYAGPARWCETMSLVRSGEMRQAAEDVRRFGEQCDLIGYDRRYRVMLLRALGVLGMQTDGIQQAISRFEEASALAAEAGMAVELVELKALLSGLYGSAGQDEQASRAHEHAASGLRSLAEGIRDADLRRSFLAASPLTRQVAG